MNSKIMNKEQRQAVYRKYDEMFDELKCKKKHGIPLTEKEYEFLYGVEWQNVFDLDSEECDDLRGKYPIDGYLDFLEDGPDVILTELAELVERTIEWGKGQSVVNNWNRIATIGVKILVETLLRSGRCSVVANNLEKFEDLGVYVDADYLTLSLRANGCDYVILENLDLLLARGAKIDLVQLLEKNDGYLWFWELYENAGRLLKAGIDPDILAEKLVQWEQGEELFGDLLGTLLKFGANASSLATLVVEHYGSTILMQHLDEFLDFGMDADLLAKKLMEREEYVVLIFYLDKFLKAKAEVDVFDLVGKLMDKLDVPSLVAGNLDKLALAGANAVDATALYNKLMMDGEYSTVANNLSKFVDIGAAINLPEFCNLLLSKDERGQVAKNLKILIDGGAEIDPTAFYQMLINVGDYVILANNIDIIAAAGARIDVNALIERLKGCGHANLIVANLAKFLKLGADIDPDAIVYKMIDKNVNILKHYVKYYNLGAMADLRPFFSQLVEKRDVWLLENFETFLKAGVDFDPVELGVDFVANCSDNEMDDYRMKLSMMGYEVRPIRQRMYELS